MSSHMLGSNNSFTPAVTAWFFPTTQTDTANWHFRDLQRWLFQTNTKQFIWFLAGQRRQPHLTCLLLIDGADRSSIHSDLPIQPPGKWNLSKVCLLIFVFHDHLWICLSPTLRRAAPACQFVPVLFGLMLYSQFFCRRWHFWNEQKPLSHRRLKTSLLFYISVSTWWRCNGVPGCSTSETSSGLMTTFQFLLESTWQSWDVWSKQRQNGGFYSSLQSKGQYLNLGIISSWKWQLKGVAVSLLPSISVSRPAALVAANNKQQCSINKKMERKDSQITLKLEFLNSRHKGPVFKQPSASFLIFLFIFFKHGWLGTLEL